MSIQPDSTPDAAARKWEDGRRRRVAPYLAAVDRYQSGELDRAGLGHALGEQVERDFLGTFMDATEAAHLAGREGGR